MLLPDTSFLLNIIIHSVLSMIRAVILYVSGVVRLWGGSKIYEVHFLNLQVSGNDIAVD